MSDAATPLGLQGALWDVVAPLQRVDVMAGPSRILFDAPRNLTGVPVPPEGLHQVANLFPTPQRIGRSLRQSQEPLWHGRAQTQLQELELSWAAIHTPVRLAATTYALPCLTVDEIPVDPFATGRPIE